MTETPYGSKVSTGWSKTTVYRKLNGQSPLDTDEMDALWRLFGISPVFLMTGTPDSRPWPGPDDGGNTSRGSVGLFVGTDSRGLELEIGVVGTDDDRVIWLVIHVMPISFRS